jgi:hypothetical protein
MGRAILLLICGLGPICCLAIIRQSTVVFKAGEKDVDGQAYHCFRIPAIKYTKAGTLIAFAEGRVDSCSDHGNVWIVVRSSSDDGKTWGNITVVAKEAGHTIGNPSPVTDMTTGAIYLHYSRDNLQAFVTSSNDDACTWDTPRNITAQVKINPAKGQWILLTEARHVWFHIYCSLHGRLVWLWCDRWCADGVWAAHNPLRRAPHRR